MATAKPYFVMDGYSFVAYPNRNSVPFREFYDIPEAETVIRGSLRYKGNPELIKALADIGWIDAEEKKWLREGLTWAQIQQRLVGAGDPSERCVRLCWYKKLPNHLLFQLLGLMHKGPMQNFHRYRKSSHYLRSPVFWSLLLRTSYHTRKQPPGYSVRPARKASELSARRARSGHASAQVCG